MTGYGSPLPEFETDEAHDYFITRLFVREGFYDYQDNNEGSTTPELPSFTAKDKILQLITENPKIKRKEIADSLGLSIDGVRYHLKKMNNDGILEFTENRMASVISVSLMFLSVHFSVLPFGMRQRPSHRQSVLKSFLK